MTDFNPLPFCLADEHHYDDIARVDDEATRFLDETSAVPEEWDRATEGIWSHMRPPGAVLPWQGWKLHVAARDADASAVLTATAAYCVGHGLAFKHLRSRHLLAWLNGKGAERGASGKFITIYPEDSDRASLAIEGLRALLDGFEAPYILGDLRIGDGPVFVRYGGFAPRYLFGPDGVPVPAVVDGDGVLVPDRRGASFTVPDGVAIPDAVVESLNAYAASRSESFPYRIERALKFSNLGGVYLADDPVRGRKVVLREARPHTAVGRDGRDAVERLQAEYRIRQELNGIDGVPEAFELIRVWEHWYLVEEYVPGTTFLEEMLFNLPMVQRPVPGRGDYAAHVRWVDDIIGRILKILRSVHDVGYWHGDVHPSNIIIGSDGTPHLIDFEFVQPLSAHASPPAPLGFQPPEDCAAGRNDLFQLLCTQIYALLPIPLQPAKYPDYAAKVLDHIGREYAMPQPFAAEYRRAAGVESPPRPLPAQGFFDDPHPATYADFKGELVASLLSSATPDRDDMLFPGDPLQLETGGHTFAYGAAGVLYTLDAVGAEIPSDLKNWLVRRALADEYAHPGFYTGLGGTAYVLAAIGERQAAADVIARCAVNIDRITAIDVFAGLSGIGLNLLDLADLLGDGALVARLDEIAARVVDGVVGAASGGGAPVQDTGLFRGWSGVAVFLTRMGEATGEDKYFDHALRALEMEADGGERLSNGTFQLRAPNTPTRRLLYLDRGSAGFAVAAARLRPNREFDPDGAIEDEVLYGLESRFMREPGLLQGRAGFVHALWRLGADAGTPALKRHLSALALHAHEHDGRLRFPGRLLFRFSEDWGTGTAGVLLAAASVFDERRPACIPLIEPRTGLPD